MSSSPAPKGPSAKSFILPVIILALILVYAIPVLLTRADRKDQAVKSEGTQTTAERTGNSSSINGNGSSSVSATPAESTAQTPPADSDTQNMAEQNEPGMTFASGSVVDREDKPVGGVNLIAYPITPNLGNALTNENPFVTRSLPDGTFRFRKVPKAPPRLLKITTAMGGDWTIEKVVEARPGDENIKVIVAPTFSAGRIFGKVIDGPEGPGIADYEVRILDINSNQKILKIVTDASGAFEFRNLKSGAYRIQSPTPESGRSLRDILDPLNPNQEFAQAAFGVLAISPEMPLQERIIILGKSLKVTGKVIDDVTGQGMGGVTLALTEGNGNAEARESTGEPTVSGPDGSFTFESAGVALRPGLEGAKPSLGLFVKDDKHLLMKGSGGGPGSWLEIDYGVYWVNLTNNGDEIVENIELRVNAAVSLEGIVSYKSGRPFEGAEVFSAKTPSIILQSPSLIQKQAVTGPDGKFTLKVSPYSTIHAGARTPQGGIFFSEPVPITPAGAQTKIIVEDDQPVDGLVLDQSGQAVQDAEVSLSLMGGNVLAQTASNEEGRFTLKRPGGSRTVVKAIKEGYFPSEAMEANRYESGVPIILVLAEPAKVRGKVVDEGGLPVQGANLGLFGDGASDLQTPIAPTGADGMFEFGPVRKGKSYSALVAKGNIDTAAYGLVAGGEEKTIVLKLDVVLNCKIIAKNAIGDPLKNYVVTLHPAEIFPVDRNPSGSGPWYVANETGILELKLAPNTDFFFEINAEGIGATTTNLLTWDYAANMPNVNQLVFEFPVVIGSMLSVTGRIVSQSDASKGIGGINLRLVPLAASQGQAPPAATSGADGTFVFQATASGGYRFIAEGKGRPPMDVPMYFATAEQAAIGDVPYYGLGNLSAHVTNSDGSPAAGLWVELTSNGGSGLFGPNQQTDTKGEAKWNDLAEGSYQIRLPAQNRYSPVEIKPDQDASVTISLGAFSASANVLYRGAPIQGAWILLQPSGGGSQITTLTDANGLANLSGLNAGDYTVSVQWPNNFFAPQGITFNPFGPSQQVLALQGDPAEVKPVLNFTMPSGMIFGAVTEDQIPSPDNMGPVLELYLNGDRSKRLITRPDALGFFFFPGLPGGNWELEFTSDISYSKYNFTLAEGQEIGDLVLPQVQQQPQPSPQP